LKTTIRKATKCPNQNQKGGERKEEKILNQKTKTRNKEGNEGGGDFN